jgi:hypothetical protein
LFLVKCPLEPKTDHPNQDAPKTSAENKNSGSAEMENSYNEDSSEISVG